MKKQNNMKPPIEHTYNEKTIYIYYETFTSNPYVLCSYTNDDKKKFKLNKSEL